MTLNIYQIQPRLVFSTGDKVYKFFNVGGECDSEVRSIKSSPMNSLFDAESKYTMRLVEIICSDDFYYVMKVARGESLASSNDYSGYYLAGRWLRNFHGSSNDSVEGEVFLFGDYVASHLYVDNVNKEVTLIDPGNNFGKIGKIEEDVARFIVGLFHTKDFDVGKLRDRLSKLIHGYGVDALNYYFLDSLVKFRINRSFEKSTVSITGFRNILLAYLWWVIANVKHRMIKRQLRKMLHGD